MTTTYTGGLSSGSGVRQGYTTTSYTSGPTATYTTGGATYGTTTGTVLGGSTYGTSTGYLGVPTTTYVGGPTTTYVAPTTTQTYVTGPVTTGYTTSTVGYHGHHTKAVAEEIPVESRIEYIPFEKKYIEYDRVERIERVPYE